MCIRALFVVVNGQVAAHTTHIIIIIFINRIIIIIHYNYLILNRFLLVCVVCLFVWDAKNLRVQNGVVYRFAVFFMSFARDLWLQ